MNNISLFSNKPRKLHRFLRSPKIPTILKSQPTPKSKQDPHTCPFSPFLLPFYALPLFSTSTTSH